MVKSGNEKGKYLYADLTYRIIGACYIIHNTLGNVHKETVYQKALSTELFDLKIPFIEEKSLDVVYKNKKVGIYKPDFIVDDKVIIELKAQIFLPQIAEKQLLYYIKGTKYKIGLLINFGSKSLEIKRKIYESSRK